MKGFHVCKPGNAPTVGKTKSFIISGDRIKSKKAEEGGQNYTITKVTPRESYSDSYDNLGFDIEIEAAGGASQSQAPHQQAAAPRQSDDRSNRIERQSARRDAIAFHALECGAGLNPTLDRVSQIMDILESWMDKKATASVDAGTKQTNPRLLAGDISEENTSIF